MRRILATGIVLASLALGHAHAQTLTTITATSFSDISFLQCSGSLILNHENCDGALLPITDGSTTAEHHAESDGSFTVSAHAEGGNTVEGRYAGSAVTIQATHTLESAASTVDMRVQFAPGGGSLTPFQGGSYANFIGLAYVGNAAPSGGQACDDGSTLIETGQTDGSFFYVTTPPASYAFRVHFACSGGGNLSAGNQFTAGVQASATALTNDTAQHADAQAGGALQQVTWTMTNE